MGVIASQSIKGAIANYIGVAIGFFNVFYVMTDCLSQEEIGLTRVLVDAAMLFSSLAQLGTNSSIIRFFPRFRDTRRPGNHGIFGWSVLLPFIGFSILTALFFAFKSSLVDVYSHQAPLIVDYFYLLLPLSFFVLYLTVFETNASVLLRITVPKLVREVGIRLFNLVAFLLYGHGVIDLDLFVWLFCGSYALAMLLNLVYLVSLGNVSFRIDPTFISRSLLKDISVYTLFMSVAVMASNISLLSSLFLGAKQGLALTGVFTIAFYISNIVEVPYRSLGAIARPLIARAVSDNDWHEANRLARQVSLHQLFVASLLFFFIWINLDPLFAVIPHGHEFSAGISVVFFLGIARIVNSSLSISGDILNFSKFYPLTLFFNLLLTALALFFNNTLVSLFGLVGAAYATLASYLIYFLFLLSFLWFRLHVSLFSLAQLRVVLLLAILFSVNALLDTFFPLVFHASLFAILLGAFLRSSFLAFVTLFLLRFIPISPEVDAMLRKIPFLHHLRRR